MSTTFIIGTICLIYGLYLVLNTKEDSDALYYGCFIVGISMAILIFGSML